MGITIHYRGAIQDPSRLEDLEDRVLDFALDVGASARIWRTACDDDPSRVVQGVMLDLAPGQDTTSLLFAPEGFLIPLTEIEAAECGRLREPPWVVVKTQFGTVEDHVRLVELLAALQREFLPQLEVSDEGGYWETRELEELRRRFSFLQSAIDGLAEGMRKYGLSQEAAEDPEIVITRIQRIAEQVHRIISRPSEHPPVQFSDDGLPWEDEPVGTEKEWDAFFKENRRKQERLHRATEKRIQRGEDPGEAFENAMRDEGIIDLPGDVTDDDQAESCGDSVLYADDFDDDCDDALGEGDDDDGDAFDDDAFDGDAFDGERQQESDSNELFSHPLQQRALEWMVKLHHLGTEEQRQSNQYSVLLGGAGDMMGGLAQALGSQMTNTDLGIGLVQLKRALRGAAFAHGALFPLRSEGLLEDELFEELRKEVGQFEADIRAELAQLRADRPQD